MRLSTCIPGKNILCCMLNKPTKLCFSQKTSQIKFFFTIMGRPDCTKSAIWLACSTSNTRKLRQSKLYDSLKTHDFLCCVLNKPTKLCFSLKKPQIKIFFTIMGRPDCRKSTICGTYAKCQTSRPKESFVLATDCKCIHTFLGPLVGLPKSCLVTHKQNLSSLMDILF